MKLRPDRITIPEANPFQNDKLERENSALALTHLIQNSPDSFVLCLNASWGAGKSTFLEMWQQMLANQTPKIHSLVFNAWENDFSGDAMVSLISELSVGVQAMIAEREDKSAIEALLQNTKRFGFGLVKRAGPFLVKAATGGLVDAADINIEGIDALASQYAEERIKQHEAAKQSVAGFRQSLSELANALVVPDEDDGSSVHACPLVIMIDELDRCRPDYAISILESVKHFFTVPNIVFVLALDKKQLGFSIASQYGQGMDVEGYLRRFIDLEFSFPAAPQEKFTGVLIDSFGLKPLGQAWSRQREQEVSTTILNVLSCLFAHFHASIRDQERCCSLLNVALRTSSMNYRPSVGLLCLLCIIKISDPEIYFQLRNRRVSGSDVIAKLGMVLKTKTFLESTVTGRMLTVHLQASLHDHHSWQGFVENERERYSAIDSNHLDYERCRYLIQVYEHSTTYELINSFDSIISCIELAAQFS